MKTETSKALMQPDFEISRNVVLRSVQDQVQRVGKSAPSVPEPQPMNDDEQQILVGQLAKLTRDIGDIIDGNQATKNLISRFARVMKKDNFDMLVDKVFVDGITWGRIIALISVIGKTVAQIIHDSVPSIVSWTLDYFRDNLLNWICSRGGWVNSIYSLACSSFERDFGSSSSLITPSFGVVFISGALLGGLIIWGLKRFA